MSALGHDRDIHLCTATQLADPMAGCDRDGFTALIDAAAASGCAGTSVWAHLTFPDALGMPAAEVAAAHADRGVPISIVEAAMSWADTPDDRDAILATSQLHFDLAEASGARHLLAVTMLPEVREDAHEGLGVLADAAAERGLRVSFEFLPWCGIPSIAAAWDLLQKAGRDNLGLCIDGWHWQRQPGGPDEATLRSIPAERIHIVQLCDAPAEPTGAAVEEAMSSRRLPGEGDVDLVALLRALDDMGAEPIVAPEVFNTALAARGPTPMAKRIVDASRSVLGAAAAR